MTAVHKRFNEAKEWIKRLPIPARLALMAFATALTGSGYIGILSEYATYWYAYNHSIRLPLEGIPYLRITIASTTFAVTSFAFCVFLFIRFHATLVIYISTKMDASISTRIDGKSFVDRLRKMPLKRFLLLTIPSIAFLMLIGYAFVRYAPLPTFPGAPRPIFGALFFGVFAAFQYAIMRWPSGRNWLGGALAFSILIAAPMILFNVDRYKQVLAILKYGGEVPISITLREAQEEAHERFEGVLLLRTGSAVFMRPQGSEHAKEFQLEAIRHIIYH